jgi:hypothetical protein
LSCAGLSLSNIRSGHVGGAAENWAAKNLPGPFDGTRERRIQQQVAEVAFAEHDNVVEAFPSDRTDQPFGIPVLPW